MSNEISTRIKLKRDTEANWGLKNPVILNGELILVDTAENGVRVKVGDGSSTYSVLPFADEYLRGLIGDTAVSEQITEAVSGKMDKQDPTGYGNVSFGRQSDTTVGSNSVVIGNNSQATNTNTIAIGSGVTASSNNSIAIGASTTASGENSVAIGIGTTASGVKSLALGDHNVASGEYATAMGCWTKAPGTAATALGNGTNSNGWGAVASGIVATAKGLGQHVFGSYNIPDDDTIENYYDTSEHLIIVGNGDVLSDNGVQSNAHTLDWDGNAWFAGDVYVGSNSGTNKDSGSKKLATVEELNGKSDLKHIHDNATTTTAGFMSASDKEKLAGIDTGATKTTIDSSLSSTSTNAVQNKAVNTAIQNLKDLVGETPIEELMAAKQNTIKGAATTITDSNLTANRALVSNGSGKVAVSAVTSTELGYLDGVSSNIQEQLDAINVQSITIDSALDSASTNPVQNSVIYSALSEKTPYQIKSSVDFNDMIIPGMYTIRQSNTNAPDSTGTYYSLIVNKSDNGNYIQQIAIKESTYDVYIRYCKGGTWNDWKRLALAEEVGDTSIDVFSTSANGLVPNPSSQDRRLFLNTQGQWLSPEAICSSNSTNKLYLIGATSQSTTGWTHSNVSCYTENGHLYSNGSQVLTQSAIQSGAVTDQSVSAQNHKNVEIIFTPSFSSIPAVTLGLAMPADQNHTVIGLSVTSVTTTGCMVQIYNDAAQEKLVAFNWIAVGS